MLFLLLWIDVFHVIYVQGQRGWSLQILENSICMMICMRSVQKFGFILIRNHCIVLYFHKQFYIFFIETKITASINENIFVDQVSSYGKSKTMRSQVWCFSCWRRYGVFTLKTFPGRYTRTCWNIQLIRAVDLNRSTVEIWSI